MTIFNILVAGGIFFLLFVGFIIVLAARSGPLSRRRRRPPFDEKSMPRRDTHDSAPAECVTGQSPCWTQGPNLAWRNGYLERSRYGIQRRASRGAMDD